METLLENWEVLVALVAIIVVSIATVVAFTALPTKRKKQLVQNWLLAAVVEAEEKLGDGTGKVKLAYVYDKFIESYKPLSMFLSYEEFEELVNGALAEMQEVLDSDDNNLLGSGNKTVEEGNLNGTDEEVSK